LEKHEVKIWSAVAFGLILYVGTFYMALASTSIYRQNLSATPSQLLQAIQK
jgi:hypothetical protein